MLSLLRLLYAAWITFLNFATVSIPFLSSSTLFRENTASYVTRVLSEWAVNGVTSEIGVNVQRAFLRRHLHLATIEPYDGRNSFERFHDHMRHLAVRPVERNLERPAPL